MTYLASLHMGRQVPFLNGCRSFPGTDLAFPGWDPRVVSAQGRLAIWRVMKEERERGTAMPMRFAHRELVTSSMIGLTAGVSIMLMVVVAALGPMNTLWTLTFTQRLAYYGVITAVEVPICFGCGFFTLYAMRRRSPVQVALALTGMCSIVVAPGVGFSVILYAAFHGGEFRQFNYLEIYGFGVLVFGGGSGLIFYVLCLRLRRADRLGRASDGAFENPLDERDSTQEAGERTSVTASSAPDSRESSRHSALVAGSEPVVGSPDATIDPDAAVGASGAGSPQADTRNVHLPDEIRENIVYVHVSGHYVEIITTSGTEVLLMRLSDVANALEGQGMQTHRSYWVAYRHVLRIEKYERRAVLHLTGEHKVPVSRSFRGEVGAFMKERERSPQ